MKALEQSRVVAGAPPAATAEPAPAPAPIVVAPVSLRPRLPCQGRNRHRSRFRRPRLPNRRPTAKDRLRGALRHPLGGLGRRHRARARRHLSGALHDPAGPDRPGRADHARRAAGGGAGRRRRMVAAHRESLPALPGLPSAHIPSILTAAGTTVAYATVYAAYGLYGFLPPAAAFILLGVVALSTLGAALLHGPALAGLGVVGAYLAPMLVASAEPDYLVALHLHRRRHRGRIRAGAIAAVALARASRRSCSARCGRCRESQFDTVTALGAHVFHALAGFALVADVFGLRLVLRAAGRAGRGRPRLDAWRSSVYLLAAALLVLASRHDPVALTAFVVLTVATVAIAWRTEAAAGAVPVAAILAAAGDGALGGAHECPGDWWRRPGPTAPAIPEPERYDYGSHLIARRRLGGAVRRRRISGARPLVARAGADAVGGHGGVRAARHADRALLPHRGARPLAAVRRRWRCCSPRSSGLRPRALVQREPRPGVMAASAMFATGTLRGAGAGVHLRAGERLAHHRAGADGAGHRLGRATSGRCRGCAGSPPSWSPWCVARVGYEPRIVGADLGTTPIFNWLLYGYGVPAAVVLGRRLAVAAARRRSAGAHGRCRRHPVHGAARGPGDPPLRHRRRHLPPVERPHRNRCSTSMSGWR